MMDWRCKIARHRRYLVPLANIGLLALWMWLYRAVFPYLGVIFTRQEFRTNQILLVGVIILILWQVRVGQYRPRLDALPQFYTPALALVLISSVLYLLVERYLDINTFSTSLFGLATYGLLGLWMRPDYWRAGLPAALLLIGALPFGEHLQTFIGYPVRLLTAEIVRAGLIRVGVGEISGQALGVNTILVFESGITKVDLPCSGVKSSVDWRAVFSCRHLDRAPGDQRALACSSYRFRIYVAGRQSWAGGYFGCGRRVGWLAVVGGDDTRAVGCDRICGRVWGCADWLALGGGCKTN